MYNNVNVDAIILARKNSKRLPYKNLKIYKGKMLFEWSIIKAINSKIFSNIIISTDSEKILNKSKKYKDSIKLDHRPNYLSQSKTKSEDVILYLIKKKFIKSKYFMLLQPTSPDRRVYDIKKCYHNMIDKNLNSMISLSNRCNDHRFIKDCIIYKNSKFRFFPKDSNLFFNGAIYLVKTNYFIKSKSLYSNSIQYAHFMPYKFSKDIDTIEDFLS